MEHIFDLLKVRHGWQGDIFDAGCILMFLGMMIVKRD